MMNIVRQIGVLHILAIRHDRVGWLHKKEWGLTIGIMTHLACMVGIVTTNAIDAIHGKSTGVTHHWK
jgi:hypothetical protein